LARAARPDFSARQLEAVLALVEYGSFVAAAARLRQSQPALTRSIQRLETQLGVRLFDRSTRRVQVTSAGREFAAVAERMLNDLDITVRSVREVASERRGLVVISCVMSVAGGQLPGTIAAYRADRPGVEIHIREGVYGSILDDVRSGVADFAVSYIDELPDFAVGTPLGRQTFHAVVPVGHKLAKRRSVELAELTRYPVVALPTESRTRRTIDAAAVTSGLHLQQLVMANQIGTLLALVRAGVGIAIVPNGVTQGPVMEGLKFIPLSEPRLIRRLGIIMLRDREPTPAAAGFMGLLRQRWPRAN
jgi:DNA-binding transcriptional LysR family regulator